MMWLQLLACLHLSVLSIDAVTSYTNSVYAVYHREHFDAVTVNSRGRFKRATLLVLHAEQCSDDLKKVTSLRDRLPPGHHLLFATYDHQLAPRYVWFQFRDVDRLEKVYGIHDCFKVLFFPSGASVKDPPTIWNPQGAPDFVQWVWDRTQVTVMVYNKLDAPLKVAFVGKGPTLDAATLQAGETQKLKCYTSYFISLSESGTFKSGGIVFRSGLTFTVRKDSKQKHTSATGLLQVVEEKEKKLSEEFIKSMVSHETRVLTNLKQPHIFPNFTRLGYKKMETPTALQDLLQGFFREHHQHGRFGMEKDTGYINTEEIPSYLVHLGLLTHVQQKVPEMIRPAMEAWCGCQLELRHLYGVREYRRGHVLYNHVDKADGHVISAIFQIDKDLGGKADWPLEITDYDGKRHDIYLESGEMLLIESGKIIHGRIQPFQGRGYANAFIHFVPKGWSVVNNGTHIIDPDKGIVEEILDPLTTITTTKPLVVSPPRIVKDEL